MITGGIYNGTDISRDGGRTWHTVPAVDSTEAVGGGGWFEAAMVTNRAGYALLHWSCG